MRTTCLLLLIIPLLLPSAFGKEEEFEVPVLVVRRGQPEKGVHGLKIMANPYGTSQIYGQIPGLTHEGRAVIRFNSPAPHVKMLFKVVDHPDGRKWYVKFYGFYPTGAPDLPPHGANAKPVPNSVLKLEAYPENELHDVAIQDLEGNRTGMVGSALADAILIPLPPGGPNTSAPITLNDPLSSYKSVAKTLHTTPDHAKVLIEKWQGLVDSAPPSAKPDEKSLSALLKGDLGKATEFGKIANGLGPADKANLAAISDTGRLFETLYQLNFAARRSGFEPQQEAAKAKLVLLENSIHPLRPKGVRIHAENIDASRLNNFSKTVRECADR